MQTLKGEKIMNAVTSFVAIVSILLALAAGGSTAKEQAQANPPQVRNITPSKIVLNHNETMVSDAALVQRAGTWSQWLKSIQAFFFTRPIPGGCEEFGCGGNHNETMVSDTALAQQADTWSQWLTSVQSFFFSKPVPGGCDEFGCGGNHNETMVSDTALAQQSDTWSQWLASVQLFIFSKPVPGGCDEFGCGSNHNETMVSDTNR
jgi:hypothetical protein